MTTASGKIISRVLHSVDQLRAVAPEWKELFVRCPDATPFQHPDWLLCWIDAFTPRDLQAIEIRHNGRLVGFAPLLIYPRDGQRVLAFAGGGVSDYLGLLAERETETYVIAEFLRATQDVPDWTVLDLTDLSSNSPLLRSERIASHSRKHDVCYVLPLPMSHDEVLQSLSKRQWANLRNARSRTGREGTPTIDLATSANVSEFLSDFIQLHTRRWSGAGQEGVLCDLRVQEFHRAAAPALLAAGVLRLYRMRLNERPIAAVYSLFHCETVFCYLQGFDPQFSHLSPGTQLMFSVVEDAVRLGMRRFDFLRGEEGYKLHWRPQGEHTYRIEVPRSTLSAEPLERAA